MSFSLFKGTSTITCNSTVSNSTVTNTVISTSSINTSTIDMGGNIITSAGTPINQTDVATKGYVDQTNPVFTNTITLTGLATTIMINKTSGCFIISIKNIISGGPSATFTLSKNDSTRQPSLSRTNSSAGLGTLERLFIVWDPGQYPKLYKTGINYDGTYTVKIVFND
jgi:hypothetical protein